jgi:hypothetical protein
MRSFNGVIRITWLRTGTSLDYDNLVIGPSEGLGAEDEFENSDVNPYPVRQGKEHRRTTKKPTVFAT